LQRIPRILREAEEGDLGAGAMPADQEGEHLRVHARFYGYQDARRSHIFGLLTQELGQQSPGQNAFPKIRKGR
jgi:hypothetical protein